MLNVLLIDVDSLGGLRKKGFPNLSLMKWSAYHKRRGDKVHLGHCQGPKRVYVSCIFTWNRPQALGLVKYYPGAEVLFGGSGFDLKSELPYEVEHIMPDYELYGVDFSLGFSSRGCIRNCPWCVVPKKEGWIREHAPINEFLHPEHKKLMLLDGNFTASPDCNLKLKFLADWGGKVSLNQGLDIRLINEEVAGLLADVKYYNSNFNERRLYFSFDLPNIESVVVKGVETLKRAGIPPRHLMFYVLCGYNTNHDEDLKRVEVLKRLGVDPFIMIYNNRMDDRWLRNLARWVNKRINCQWEEYNYGDSQKQILKEATIN